MIIISKNEQEHLICGIVATVGVEDTQGDVIESIEELQAAAWDFYQNGQGFNIDHKKDIAEKDVQIVESYVTDDAPVIKDGQEIPPHSWVITARVSEALWPIISKCHGLSMEGVAREATR